MKIKAVCEATGLSDRAIRYYIDEELVYPAYTENYLGRRSYDFSDADVNTLNSISMLRKYGFSVAEIRTMIRNPSSIPQTVQGLITRKKEAAATEAELIARLERAEREPCPDVSALADALSVTDIAAPDANVKPHIAKRVFRIVRRILMTIYACLPIAAALFGLNESFHFVRYPVIDPLAIVITVLLLIPSVLLLILPSVKKGGRWKKIVRIVLSVLVFLSILPACVAAITVVSHSETHDVYDYREFDRGIPVDYCNIAYTFFTPDTHFFQYDKAAHDSILVGSYLYRNLTAWNYTYDIYAEWPTTAEKLEREKSRISELFKIKEEEYNYWNRCDMQHGSYQCMILYNGTEPFRPAEDNYKYYIFAYDEDSLRVRYILCDSQEHGEDQPYYLELDWNE